MAAVAAREEKRAVFDDSELDKKQNADLKHLEVTPDRDWCCVEQGETEDAACIKVWNELKLGKGGASPQSIASETKRMQLLHRQKGAKKSRGVVLALRDPAH